MGDASGLTILINMILKCEERKSKCKIQMANWDQRGARNLPVKRRRHYNKLHLTEDLTCTEKSTGSKTNRINCTKEYQTLSSLLSLSIYRQNVNSLKSFGVLYSPMLFVPLSFVISHVKPLLSLPMVLFTGILYLQRVTRTRTWNMPGLMVLEAR